MNDEDVKEKSSQTGKVVGGCVLFAAAHGVFFSVLDVGKEKEE
jgi:hypothetical protein